MTTYRTDRNRVTRLGIACLKLVIVEAAIFMAGSLIGWADAAPVTPTGNRPAISAAPGSDGSSLTVLAGRLGNLAIPVYANVTVLGPTSYERSHAMGYNSGDDEYGHTFGGLFTAGTTLEGSISISTTVTGTLGISPYVRHYIPGTSPLALPSSDGWLSLHIGTDSLPSNTYLVIMSTGAPPGDPPPGHRLIGESYSVRASGWISESLKAMTLHMSYTPAQLAGADPHRLSIFAWGLSDKRWGELEGSQNFGQNYVTKNIKRFTTYALMVTPRWRDEFNDLTGLSERQGVSLAYGGKLELTNGAISGWATSTPIARDAGSAWAQILYTAVVPANTALSVDVLDGSTGQVLLTNVADGARLDAIEPQAHPTLRLRVSVSTSLPGTSPSLDAWSLSWGPAEDQHKVYLPLLLQSDRLGQDAPLNDRSGQSWLEGNRSTAKQPASFFGCAPPSTPPIAWSAAANLTNNVGHSLSPALAVDDRGTLHAAWYDNSAGNLDVYYASRSAGTASWSAPVRLANTPGGSYWPAITVDRFGNIHIAWEDSPAATTAGQETRIFDATPGAVAAGRSILYAMKPAGSTTWTTPIDISRSSGLARFVVLAPDSAGKVHAVWVDDASGNYEIYYAAREPGSGAWSTPALIAATPATSYWPSLAIGPDNSLHVAWHDFTPGTTEIYYVTKPSQAAAWSSPTNISHTTGTSYNPVLVVDSRGGVHAVWMDAIVADFNAPFRVLYAQKSPGGAWTPYVNLSRTTGSAEFPTLALGPADALHVAWDTVGETPGLLYVRRPAPEMGWTAPMTVSLISPAAQYPAPSLAAGLGEEVHLLWSDFGDLSRDVFYSWTAPPPIPTNHVLVLDELGQAVAGACIYRNGLPTVSTDDTGVAAPPIMSSGDALAAIYPIAEQLTPRQEHATEDPEGANWAYRVTLTNLDISGVGDVHPYVVSQPGQQRLVVRNNNPLVLYNLVISVEWDATPEYLEQLTRALRSASDYLYDVSDGQMAFGRVAIYDNGSHWQDADIQVSTHNRTRPYAFVGGILSSDKSWRIRIGRGWDRVGDSTQPWDAPDGFRTLVHEFGHYALFLYDEYFAYLQDGENLIGEEPGPHGCTDPDHSSLTHASIMDFQYTSSELADQRVPSLWSEWCKKTAQWQLNRNESDWDTVTRRYQDTAALSRWRLVRPADRGSVMAGPVAFPSDLLPFPQIEVQNGGIDSTPRQLTVLKTDGQPYSQGAQVSLDTRRAGSAVTIDQGQTDPAGRIAILGAAAGNVVRVQTLEGDRWAELTMGDSQSYTAILSSAGRLAAISGSLNPYVSLIPGSGGDTLTVVLRGVAPGAVVRSLVAPPGNASPVLTPLSYSATTGEYLGTVSFAALAPGIGGVYVRGLDPAGSTVTADSNYSLLAVDLSKENDIYSPDGNLWLHLDAGASDAGTMYTVLMPSGSIPQPLPFGRKSIGNAYAIRFSGGRLVLDRPGVLKLFYPPDRTGRSADLAIYRWDPAAETWQILGGELDTDRRSLAVAFNRAGIYALLAMDTALPKEKTYLPLLLR